MPVPVLNAPIEPDWIDYNGHMNMARYPILFDRAVDLLIDKIGLPSEPGDGETLFALESQLQYLRAVMPDDVVSVHTRVLRADAKRVHTWQELRVGSHVAGTSMHVAGTSMQVAATSENLHICVMRNGADARSVPFSDGVAAKLATLQISDPWPETAGQPIAARMEPPAS